MNGGKSIMCGSHQKTDDCDVGRMLIERLCKVVISSQGQSHQAYRKDNKNMGLIDDIKKEAAKSGASKSKIFYLKDGQKSRVRFLDDM